LEHHYIHATVLAALVAGLKIGDLRIRVEEAFSFIFGLSLASAITERGASIGT
jgi:hypothetical protein